MSNRNDNTKYINIQFRVEEDIYERFKLVLKKYKFRNTSQEFKHFMVETIKEYENRD